MLRLALVSLSDHSTRFSCVATNNNITSPAVTAIVLDVRELPSSVKISSPTVELVEGVGVTLECLVEGGHPQPKVVWLVNRTRLLSNGQYTETEGNTVMSALFLTPTRELHNAELTCRAEVANMTGSIQDSVILDVKYSPRVSIKTPLELDNIREGHDVYFSCQVDSNPPAENINWIYNGVPLDVKARALPGLLGSDNILAIQSVSRVRKTHSGRYSCSASNSVASNTSQPLLLVVKYKPKCHHGLQLKYPAFSEKVISIPCTVEANPSNNLIFKWEFNGSTPDYIQKDRGNTSSIQWIPSLSDEMTSLTCRASNSVGLQEEPCVFTILSQFPPLPPHTCSVLNITHSQFQVVCPGGSGKVGEDSSYQLVVSVSSTGEKVYSGKGRSSSFLVSHLVPSTSYSLKLWAVNSLGSSQPSYMSTTTLNVPDPAERKYKNESQPGGSSFLWLSVFLGLSVLVALLLFSLLAISLRRRSTAEMAGPEVEVDSYSLYEPQQCPELEQDSIKTKKTVEEGEVYNCSDVTMQTITYASLASSSRNKPIRESFI